MYSVEAVGACHEVGRSFRRASDAAQLGHALRLNAHFVHGVNDAFGNRIVAAPRAQRSLSAAIIEDGKSQAIGFRSRTGWCGGHYFPSMAAISSVTERASSGRP